MQVGRAIRTRLGRFEVPASRLYRSFFINLEDCAALLGSAFPARRILEVGCGDGQMAQQLMAQFPRATYVGLDIAPEVGRLYDGDRDAATFLSESTSAYLRRSPQPFDLVLLIDVVHHVPDPDRDELFRDIRELTRPDGHYVVKDWDPTRTIGNAAAHVADRLVSGTQISFLTGAQLRQRISRVLPEDELVLQARVPPRRNNLLLGYRRAPTSN